MITRHWTPVPCVVLVSGVRESQYSENDPKKWQPDLEYRYTFNGKVYHGTKLRRIEGPSPHRARAVASAAAFPAGLETQCFVNPENPSEAALEHSTKAAFTPCGGRFCLQQVERECCGRLCAPVPENSLPAPAPGPKVRADFRKEVEFQAFATILCQTCLSSLILLPTARAKPIKLSKIQPITRSVRGVTRLC